MPNCLIPIRATVVIAPLKLPTHVEASGLQPRDSSSFASEKVPKFGPRCSCHKIWEERTTGSQSGAQSGNKDDSLVRIRENVCLIELKLKSANPTATESGGVT